MNTIAQQLRDELRAAHTVILNALAVMTMDQKIDWGRANERDDVAGEGVTRHRERQVVIEGGSPLAVFLELHRADRIIANAWDIQSFHQHALWSTANQQDGVAVTHPTRADSRSKVFAAAIAAAHELVGDARGAIADGIIGYVQSFADAASGKSSVWCGVDFAAPGGDQRIVLKQPRNWSNADIARLRWALTKRNHGGTLHVEQPAPRQIEEMIRFCPECGHLGDIAAGYEACCPDWSQARVVPKRFAELCAETFKLCVRRPYGAATAPADSRAAAAVRTLEAKAYTYTDGAELWKPPLGPESIQMTRRFIRTITHANEVWQGGVKLASATTNAIAAEIADAINAKASAPASAEAVPHIPQP
ncbi:hypothetical protein [Burkholderia multivorans]|uniref:hypothetical protein n=1 Tax=Burkholderia multivorans TaxID=87883 RepID=UPI00201946E8|nr:hypothetical protein [Burkholderia multivorans]MCL4627714.1 hypothetical protein [Burkholderia multivorans]MCO1390788.1 hypothetical protein [Burkholderia multivorans]UQO13084.1 hypothetical protein L0Z40_21350 [Burkholderia multivorans]UQO55291.1 hypothetical protein L0Z30_05330 [Burkholderia multivorans]UQO63784.1 hypothetical protein L0Z29_20910 [Burkholderia multivorans]